MTQGLAWKLGLAAWAIALALSGWWQLSYERTPGDPGTLPLLPPPYAELGAQPGRTLVVMGVHPRCPCVQASLRDLEEASRAWPPGVVIRILQIVPPGADAPERWEDPGVNAYAEHFGPGTLVRDDDAELARRLGMRTSGHVVAFNPSGDLTFVGGLTLLRGHSGPAEPVRMLTTAVRDGRRRPAVEPILPVFGCSLFTKAVNLDKACGDDPL